MALTSNFSYNCTPMCDYEPKDPFSLLDLAALKVARNLNVTLSALTVVPHSLYPVLLAASLDTKLVVATKAIVAAWPQTTLSFKSLQKLTRLSKFTNNVNQCHDEPVLAVAMAISEQKNSRIQDIDVTSLRFYEKTEKRFLEELLKGRKGADAEPRIKKRKRKTTHSEYPALRVIMNSRISGSGAMDYLNLLKRLHDANIRVWHRRLSVSQNGLEQLEKVLSSVEKEATSELDIGYNRLENSGLTRALRQVQPFQAVSVLSVHYNQISVRDEDADSAIRVLGSGLAGLPSLKCLKLTGNRLTRRLAEILRPIPQPLTGLDISACMLAEDDISYLTGSHHAPALEQLVLRDNKVIGANPRATEQLLTGVSGSLVELNLEKTGLGEEQQTLDKLVALLPKFSNLAWLDIHNNELQCDFQVDIVLACAKSPSMRELHLSFPTKPMDTPWIFYRKHKLTKRQSPYDELSSCKWFMLSCLKQLSKTAPECRVSGAPMWVHVFDEDCVIDHPTFEFPIPMIALDYLDN